MYNKDAFTKNMNTWLINFIEAPNSGLNNWPPCPFAKKSRIENKIKMNFSEPNKYFDCVENEIINFDNSSDISIVGTDPNNIGVDDCMKFVNEKRAKYKKDDIWILLDHPSRVEKNKNIIFNNGDYLLIFIQKLSILKKSSDELLEAGYYKNWDEEYLSKLFIR